MAVAAIEHEQEEDPTCWCCGSTFSEEGLVRLGNHPEVGVCPRCAQWLHRRARSSVDAGRRTPVTVMRRGLDTARGRVMRAGAQHWPVVGPLLRRLDRHLA
jgi:hypothetical protein